MEQRPDGTFDFGLVNARSWWIAVELCRRHPHLVMGEWGAHNGNESGAPRDALGVYDDGAGVLLIELNRAGRLSVPGGSGSPGFSLAWSQVFAAPPFTTVTALEQAAGLDAPARRLRTTGHLLSYRVGAALVGLGATGRRPWDMRSAFPMDRDAAPAAHLFDEFRGAADRRAAAPGAPLGDAGHGFWALRRNGGADYLLDHWGWLYTRDHPPRDLHGPYRDRGRNLWRLVADVFGDELD